MKDRSQLLRHYYIKLNIFGKLTLSPNNGIFSAPVYPPITREDLE